MATEIAKYSFDNVKVMWTKLQEDKHEAPYQGEGTHNWTIQVILDDVQADKYKETSLFPKFKRNQEHDIVLEEGLRQVKLKKSKNASKCSKITLNWQRIGKFRGRSTNAFRPSARSSN